jgi:hypothetical protein
VTKKTIKTTIYLLTLKTKVMTEQTKIMLENVRVSYVHVFEPTAIDGNSEAKYSCCVLIPKNDVANLAKVNEAMGVAFRNGLQKKWGGKTPAILKNPLRDGDSKDIEKNPEYSGMMFINAGNKNKPMAIDRQREPITDASGFYSGCFANVLVNFFPYKTAGNNGVGCSLMGVQFVRDGERLAGGASTSDFEELTPEGNPFGV